MKPLPQRYRHARIETIKNLTILWNLPGKTIDNAYNPELAHSVQYPVCLNMFTDLSNLAIATKNVPERYVLNNILNQYYKGENPTEPYNSGSQLFWAFALIKPDPNVEEYWRRYPLSYCCPPKFPFFSITACQDDYIFFSETSFPNQPIGFPWWAPLYQMQGNEDDYFEIGSNNPQLTQQSKTVFSLLAEIFVSKFNFYSPSSPEPIEETGTLSVTWEIYENHDS